MGTAREGQGEPRTEACARARGRWRPGRPAAGCRRGRGGIGSGGRRTATLGRGSRLSSTTCIRGYEKVLVRSAAKRLWLERRDRPRKCLRTRSYDVAGFGQPVTCKLLALCAKIRRASGAANCAVPLVLRRSRPSECPLIRQQFLGSLLGLFPSRVRPKPVSQACPEIAHFGLVRFPSPSRLGNFETRHRSSVTRELSMQMVLSQTSGMAPVLRSI